MKRKHKEIRQGSDNRFEREKIHCQDFGLKRKVKGRHSTFSTFFSQPNTKKKCNLQSHATSTQLSDMFIKSSVGFVTAVTLFKTGLLVMDSIFLLGSRNIGFDVPHLLLIKICKILIPKPLYPCITK